MAYWRRGAESNRRIKVLQTSPLPLGYRAPKPRCAKAKNWSGRRDLNPRLRPWQGRTLPLSYSRSSSHFTALAGFGQITAPTLHPHCTPAQFPRNAVLRELLLLSLACSARNVTLRFRCGSNQGQFGHAGFRVTKYPRVSSPEARESVSIKYP